MGIEFIIIIVIVIISKYPNDTSFKTARFLEFSSCTSQLTSSTRLHFILSERMWCI